MKLSLAFSPCPNDTFMFDALVNNRIDHDLDFEIHLEDIKTLNNWAFEGKADISKMSFHAMTQVMDKYQLLRSGAALGFGVGPLLISKEKIALNDVNNKSIAIPGKNTTANFLMNYAFPNANDKKEYLFHQIENAVLNDEVDLGVIIHENRFTYEAKGLVKIMDLGANWEEKTACAIPLGGIVIKRKLDQDLKNKIEALIAQSVRFAFNHPNASSAYVAENAQEMDSVVVQKHIDLYVNDYSIDIKKQGEAAVFKVFEAILARNEGKFDKSSIFLS